MLDLFTYMIDNLLYRAKHIPDNIRTLIRPSGWCSVQAKSDLVIGLYRGIFIIEEPTKVGLYNSRCNCDFLYYPCTKSTKTKQGATE